MQPVEAVLAVAVGRGARNAPPSPASKVPLALTSRNRFSVAPTTCSPGVKPSPLASRNTYPVIDARSMAASNERPSSRSKESRRRGAFVFVPVVIPCRARRVPLN